MPAMIPLKPAPMTMTLMGTYSSTQKSPRGNVDGGVTGSTGPFIFALARSLESPRTDIEVSGSMSDEATGLREEYKSFRAAC